MINNHSAGDEAVSALNPDAYAFIILQREYREQMERHARLRDRERSIRADLERAVADAMTAAERATSIMETLLKLEPPRDAAPPSAPERKVHDQQ